MIYFKTTIPATRHPNHINTGDDDDDDDNGMSRRNTRNFEVRSLNLRDSSLSPLLRIHLAENVRTLCDKVRTRIRRDRRRDIQIVRSPFLHTHTLPSPPTKHSN